MRYWVYSEEITSESEMIKVEDVMMVGGLILLVLLATVMMTDVPDVQFSIETEKCVKVIPESAGSCDDIPRRYNHVWVQ